METGASHTNVNGFLVGKTSKPHSQRLDTNPSNQGQSFTWVNRKLKRQKTRHHYAP